MVLKDNATQGRLTRERIWTLLCGAEDHKDAAAALCERLGVTPLTARLLCNRGYTDPAEAERLSDDTYRRALATVIFSAITSHMERT